MNSALEPLLLAILRDEDGGWGQAPTPLRGGLRPQGLVRETRLRRGAAGNEKRWLFQGVTGPRIGRREPDHCRSIRLLFARPQFVNGFSRLRGWATCFWAAAAGSLSRRRRGLEKGRGGLGRRYRCHHCRRLPPRGTPVTPPTPPSCYSGSSQHKMPPVPGSRFFTAQSTLGKGSRALAPEGRQREGGRNRIRESRGPRSERHPVIAQPRMRTATLLIAQACGGLSSPPPGAHFHFRLFAVRIKLPVTHVGPAWSLKGRAASGPESMLGRSHLHSSWRMGTSGFLRSFDLCSLRRFLTFDLSLGHSLRPACSSPILFCERLSPLVERKRKAALAGLGLVRAPGSRV